MAHPTYTPSDDARAALAEAHAAARRRQHLQVPTEALTFALAVQRRENHFPELIEQVVAIGHPQAS